MPKVYTEKDVLTSAFERLEYVFTHFDNFYFSISGGKDSSVMLQLAAMKARELNKKFSVLYVDFEAQYKATINHIYDLIDEVSDCLQDWYWIALPLSLRNAVSVIQSKWICWDKLDKKKWVREMPTNKYVINEKNYPKEWTWFYKGMEFEQFIIYFAEWYNKRNGGNSACGVAIRTDESLNRFRTITNRSKETFNGRKWTTRVKYSTHNTNTYTFFPIYDFSTADIWGTVAKYDLKYNEIYEQMYKNGVPIYEQRLCQPYGDDQRKGLNQFKSLEYETWEKVLNRVHGVNFGNIYCRTSLLGMLKTEKPDGMTWQQYAVFLLESLGLYAPELRDHYYHKISNFLKWYSTRKGIKVSDIKDEEDKKLENAKKVASWRRIARAIEHNDFWMKRLSFSQTKSDVKKLYQLREKYRNLLSNNNNDKDLDNISRQMNKEDSNV